MQVSVQEIAEMCGGRLLCGDPAQIVTNVQIDSRQAGPESLFVPLKGEKTDAHQYIPAVFAAGAAACLTQETVEPPRVPGAALLAVPDTAAALQKLAAAYRRRFTGPVIGITGSVGKTSTKEMVALALSVRYRVMKTHGNQNSQIGVPLTMFQLRPETEAAVVEMGMSQFGEMARLAKIAAPQFAVMTNIGLSHIENLHTQENILREKLHIIDGFVPDSVLVLNAEDPMLAGLRGKLSCRTVFVGTSSFCDYRAEELQLGPIGTHFQLHCGARTLPVSLPVPGKYQVIHALEALAIADILHVDLQQAAAALARYQPPAMRQQIYRLPHLTLIDDSYNASPDAVCGALDILCQFPRRRVAVLADMLELGEASQAAHWNCGVHAARAGVDCLLTVGRQAQAIAEGARSQGLQAVTVCESNAQAIAHLLGELQPGDTVLVKGSRGMHTDEIVKAFLQKSRNDS